MKAIHRIHHIAASVLCFALVTTWLPGSAVAAPISSPVRQEQANESALQVLQSDETVVTLELVTTAFQVIDDVDGAGPCQRVEIGNLPQAGDAGEPLLPVRVALIGVPPQAELSLTVTPVESEVVATDFTPCAAPTAGQEPGEGELLRYVEQPALPTPAIYAQDANFPNQAARLDELGFMRSQRMARVELYPFQVNAATHSLLQHRRLQVTIHFSGNGGVSAASILEDNATEATLSGLLANYESAREWRGAPVQAAAADYWRPPLNAYRVLVEKEGIYALTYADLAAAGLPVATIVPQNFRMHYNGQEIAIRVIGAENSKFDPGDQILFYGTATNERYARYNAYWLSYGSTAGLRMANRSSANTPNAVTTYSAKLRVEENKAYVSSLPMLSGYDHWYGGRLTATGAGGTSQLETPITLSDLASGAGNATLELAAAGNVRGVHHLRVYVNNTQVGDFKWNDRTYTETVTSFAQSLFQPGANTIRFELINDAPGQTVDMVYLDWFRLSYKRTLVAQADQLLFDGAGAGAWRYTVGGFSAGEVEAYDIADPSNVAIIGGSTAAGLFAFNDNLNSARRYLAQTTAKRLAPVSISKAASSNLLTPTTGADYIVIAPKEFVGAVEPLAQLRASQGYRVRVLDVQEVYDQFNYGRVSALAIRDFLASAYVSWPAPAPAFVLLIGDGHYDPRGYLPASRPVYIPPFLETVDPDLGETASDNRFVTIAGDDLLPDMNIGRFSAESVADVTNMVDKTLAYASAATTDNWNQNILFVSDNLQGGGGNFYKFSDSIVDGVVQGPSGSIPLIPSGYTKSKLYMGKECPVENPAATCQQQVVADINRGALFVSYVGHGTKQYWAEEKLMTLTSLQALSNASRLPIILAMTCLEGFFHEADPSQVAFGESIVRMAGNGAVASWSPTGFGLATGHDYLERGFFLGVFHQGLDEAGAAATYGKLHLLANAPAGKYDDLVDTFVFFGDPLLQVRVTGSQPIVREYKTYLPITSR